METLERDAVVCETPTAQENAAAENAEAWEEEFAKEAEEYCSGAVSPMLLPDYRNK